MASPAQPASAPSLLSDLLLLQFRRDDSESNNQQLYRLIRDGILQEILPPGLRLPSSRQLADELGLRRWAR